MQAFLGGLISIFTPGVLFMAFIVIIALSKITMTKWNRLYLVSAFCAIVIVSYAAIGVLIMNATPGNLSAYSSYQTIKYLLTLLNLIIGFWLLKLFSFISPEMESKPMFVSLMVGITYLLFIGSSVSGTGPIIGALLVEGAGSESLSSVIIPLIIFALGLVFPLWFIIVFSARLFSKNKEKNWLKVLQMSAGAILIASSIIGVFMK
jgi:cytochrome c biogenesis protein CcdA